MADFKIAYLKTSIIEGGYANDPDDHGGETYKGIARKSDSKWKGWSIIDAIKSKVGTSSIAIDKEAAKHDELQSFVLDYYKTNYWDSLTLDKIDDQTIANELYDTGVNMGIGRAALFFQRVLNVANKNGKLFPNLTLDGKVGTQTINTFNGLCSTDKIMVYKLLNCLQGEKYISICEANPVQEKFLRSWASRVF